MSQASRIVWTSRDGNLRVVRGATKRIRVNGVEYEPFHFAESKDGVDGVGHGRWSLLQAGTSTQRLIDGIGELAGGD